MASAPVLDQLTTQAIRSSLAAASLGRIAEACRIANDALAQGGDPASLNALIGSLHLRSGELPAATRHLQEAHSRNPSDPVVAFNLATVLAQQSEFAAAAEVLPATLGRGGDLRLHWLRGTIAQGVEDFPTAVAAYERVVAADPSHWEAWNNLGNCRSAEGDFDGALEALRRAQRLVPDAAPVRYNLATTLARAGRRDEAEREFREMGEQFPDDWRPFRELFKLLQAQGREEDALPAIEEAARRNPEDMELLLGVASHRLLLLDHDGAEAAYREVIRREPANRLGHLGVAVALDLSNRIDALSVAVAEAEAMNVEAGVMSFMRAFDHRRRKRFAEGLKELEQVPEELEIARRAHLQGQLSEGAGLYEQAWQAFERMNEIQLEDESQPAMRAERYRDFLKKRLNTMTTDWADKWQDVPVDERASPAFLVGFPRSGTTLLDTFLMGHPQLAVLEEEPTLQSAHDIVPDFRDLPAATPEQVSQGRDGYFNFASTKAEFPDGTLLIDKNPLLTNALPLARRLFPDAKIIVALRHPCDVIVSCFATNFSLNDGMASFLKLETAAELYDVTFSIFERVRELIPMPMHMIRYEDLVAEPEAELRRVLEFLEVPWNEGVVDHQSTARQRGMIKTASYAQVVEPIYSRSMGRWRNYERHLKPVLPILEPWVRKFGYEL